MSDSLRDRITAVVSDHYVEDEGATWWRCICGQAFYIPEDSYRSCEEHVADAVIAELQLHPETYIFADGPIVTRLDGKVLSDHRQMFRWATPWVAKEQADDD